MKRQRSFHRRSLFFQGKSIYVGSADFKNLFPSQKTLQQNKAPAVSPHHLGQSYLKTQKPHYETLPWVARHGRRLPAVQLLCAAPTSAPCLSQEKGSGPRESSSGPYPAAFGRPPMVSADTRIRFPIEVVRRVYRRTSRSKEDNFLSEKTIKAFSGFTVILTSSPSLSQCA